MNRLWDSCALLLWNPRLLEFWITCSLSSVTSESAWASTHQLRRVKLATRTNHFYLHTGKYHALGIGMLLTLHENYHTRLIYLSLLQVIMTRIVQITWGLKKRNAPMLLVTRLPQGQELRFVNVELSSSLILSHEHIVFLIFSLLARKSPTRGDDEGADIGIMNKSRAFRSSSIWGKIVERIVVYADKKKVRNIANVP